MTHHVATVGIDLAKNSFPLVGTDTTGRMVWRQRLTRHALGPLMAQLPRWPAAWGGAHAWARPGHPPGHPVTRMAPQFVKPDVQSNTNDRRAAEAMAEAVTRPTRRLVPLTDVDQPALPARPRGRERLSGARTAVINAGHGFRPADGIVRPTGVAQFRQAVVETRESEPGTLPPLSQERCWRLVQEVATLAEAIAADQEPLDTLAQRHPESQRLMTIPGVGPSTATALVAAGGDGGGVKHGRQLAAWWGWVPHQHATGGQTPVWGISTRGDRYVRKRFIHGARATLRGAGRQTTRRRPWRQGWLQRRGGNRTAVAVAHQTARLVWAVLSRGGAYRETASESREQVPWGDRPGWAEPPARVVVRRSPG